MKPFFVYSHLGIDINFWNTFISSHKRIQSNFIPSENRIYENSDLKENTPKVSKWYFSKAKWFDILLHNYQVGYKDFYKNFPSIVIIGSQSLANKNIINHRIMERSFSNDYLELRLRRLLYICKQADKPLVFVDGFSPVDVMRQMLCEFLDIPYEFEEDFQQNSSETLDLKTLEYLYDLDLAGKIRLAVQ